MPSMGALHGDDAHQAVAVGQDGTHGLHAQAGVLLKGAADLGVGLHQGDVVDHHLQDAGGEDLHEVDVLAVRLAVGAAEHAVVDQIVERGHDLLHALADLFGQPSRGALLAQTRRDGDVGLVVADDVGQRL